MKCENCGVIYKSTLLTPFDTGEFFLCDKCAKTPPGREDVASTEFRLCNTCGNLAPRNKNCPICLNKDDSQDKLFDMNAGMVLQSNFDFVGKAQQIGELLKSKNAQYGSAYRTSESMLKILYPNGVQPQDYVFALLLVRIWDKMCRIASPNKSLDSETPFADIAGYGILGCEVWESEQTKEGKSNE